MQMKSQVSGNEEPVKVRSAPSCDHFGRHGEWKKFLATKVLVKVANWRPTD